MKRLKEFIIPFVGLKEGEHTFEYQIDKTFFDAFSFDEFNEVNTVATVILTKKATLLELSFLIKGTVNIPCDLTGELFDLPVTGNMDLIVKFGHEYNDENEEILIIPHHEYQIDIAQYIYELIVLSVPTKRIHPNVLDGTMKSEVLDKLKELEVKDDNNLPTDTNTVESTDPRWDKLKDLLTE